MRKSLLVGAVLSFIGARTSAAPVVSPVGVRVELGAHRSLLFESVGKDADTLPLDWPTAATEAEVTLTRKGRETVLTIDDRSVSTLTLAVPASSAEEACVVVSVAFRDGDGNVRRTDRAVVYAVTGLNGAAARFVSPELSASDWATYVEKTPVIATLAADDAVTRNGETVAPVQPVVSFYRTLAWAARGVVTSVALTSADGASVYDVELMRMGPGLVLVFK